MRFLYRVMLRAATVATLVLATVALPPGALAGDDDNRFGTWIYPGTVDEIGEQPVEHLGELERENDGDDFYYIPFGFGAVEADAFWED